MIFGEYILMISYEVYLTYSTIFGFVSSIFYLRFDYKYILSYLRGLVIYIFSLFLGIS